MIYSAVYILHLINTTDSQKCIENANLAKTPTNYVHI